MVNRITLIIILIPLLGIPLALISQDHNILIQGAGSKSHNSYSLNYDYNIQSISTNWTQILMGTGFGRFVSEQEGNNNATYTFIKVTGGTLIGKKNSFLELQYGPLLKLQTTNKFSPHFSIGFRMYFRSFSFRFGHSSHEEFYVSAGMHF